MPRSLWREHTKSRRTAMPRLSFRVLALMAGGLVEDFREARRLAEESIDSGAALGKLEALRRHTQRLRALRAEDVNARGGTSGESGGTRR